MAEYPGLNIEIKSLKEIPKNIFYFSGLNYFKTACFATESGI